MINRFSLSSIFKFSCDLLLEFGRLISWIAGIIHASSLQSLIYTIISFFKKNLLCFFFDRFYRWFSANFVDFFCNFLIRFLNRNYIYNRYSWFSATVAIFYYKSCKISLFMIFCKFMILCNFFLLLLYVNLMFISFFDYFLFYAVWFRFRFRFFLSVVIVFMLQSQDCVIW